jgi:hypothetical protein
MSSWGYWAEQSAPIIRRVLAETRGEEERVIRKALIAAYPFGPRSCWPYRAWLGEIRRQRGLLKARPRKHDPGQLELFSKG